MDASVRRLGNLAYEDRGTGFPVVFIHGLTFNKETWRPITDRLVDLFRCIAIDLPGHGGSPGLPHSMGEAARDIHVLLGDLEVERPVMVGHSLGAIFATLYASRYPVSGVVNVDQTLQIQPFSHMLRQMAPALCGPNFGEAFEPIRRSIGVELLPEPLRSRVLAAQTVRQNLVLAYWDEPLRRSPEEMQALVDDAIRTITVPYLAVFGRRLSDEERTSLRHQVPTLELEEWPDQGHMVHLMEPERFTDRTVRFIDQCSASRRSV